MNAAVFGVIAGALTTCVILIGGIIWGSRREARRRARAPEGVAEEPADAGTFMLKVFIVAFLAGLLVLRIGIAIYCWTPGNSCVL